MTKSDMIGPMIKMRFTYGELLRRRKFDLFYDLSDDDIQYLAESQIKADKLDELLIKWLFDQK